MSKGYYFAQKRPKNRWRLVHETWQANKPTRRVIGWAEARALGLTPNLPIDAARAIVKRINQGRALEAKLAAAKRAATLTSLNEHLFEPSMVAEFEAVLKKQQIEQGSKPKNLTKQFGAFRFLQRMAVDLELGHTTYADRAQDIHAYFIARKLSYATAKYYYAIFNRWAEFVCKRTGAYFDKLHLPKGIIKARLVDEQETKSGVNSLRGVNIASAPLSWELLGSIKRSCPEPQWQWLHISLAFGLRPHEITKDISWGTDPGTKVAYIRVYQPKLISVPKSQRYKHIPVLYREQQQALEYLQAGNWKKPAVKNIHKWFGLEYNGYAGRKGFFDWMRSQGQVLEHIAVWMGHRSVQTTWTYYKDKQSIRFTKTPGMIRRVK